MRSSEQVLWEDGNPALKIIRNTLRHEESEGAGKAHSRGSQVLAKAPAAVFHFLVCFGSLTPQQNVDLFLYPVFVVRCIGVGALLVPVNGMVLNESGTFMRVFFLCIRVYSVSWCVCVRTCVRRLVFMRCQFQL